MAAEQPQLLTELRQVLEHELGETARYFHDAHIQHLVDKGYRTAQDLYDAGTQPGMLEGLDLPDARKANLLARFKAVAQQQTAPAGVLARLLRWFSRVWSQPLLLRELRTLSTRVNNIQDTLDRHDGRLDDVQDTLGAFVRQLSWQDNSSASSDFAMQLSRRMNVGLRTHVQLRTCCGFNFATGPAPPRVPWLRPENNTTQVQLCQDHLQRFVAPAGVTVYYVGNRKFLNATSASQRFNLSGKTDMLFLARAIPGRNTATELTAQEISLNIDAVIGMYEIKTETAYDRGAIWPQAVVECLAFRHMTGRCIPTFAGDLNRNFVLHWTSDGDELHVGQDSDLSVAVMQHLLKEEQRLYEDRHGDTITSPRQHSDGGAIAQESTGAGLSNPRGIIRRTAAAQHQQLLRQRPASGSGGQQHGHPVAAPDGLVAVMAKRFPTLLSPSKLESMDAVWQDSTRLVEELCEDSKDLEGVRSMTGSEWAASFVARMAALSEQAGQAEQAT